MSCTSSFPPLRFTRTGTARWWTMGCLPTSGTYTTAAIPFRSSYTRSDHLEQRARYCHLVTHHRNRQEQAWSHTDAPCRRDMAPIVAARPACDWCTSRKALNDRPSSLEHHHQSAQLADYRPRNETSMGTMSRAQLCKALCTGSVRGSGFTEEQIAGTLHLSFSSDSSSHAGSKWFNR